MRFILRGTGSISYETRVNHEMHFAWQAQYLVKLEASTLLLRAL